jgi:catechol 2,3-dioxygenase-like lactoylglutathione lyase family enzyme
MITLFVEDLQAAKQFYREVFGLPVMFEDENSAVFKFGNTLINLLKTTAAPALIEPASVASLEAGSRFQFTIEVDDVDAMCAELATRGVKLLERSGGSALGNTNRQLHGSQPPHLGNRAAGNCCSYRADGAGGSLSPRQPRLTWGGDSRPPRESVPLR